MAENFLQTTFASFPVRLSADTKQWECPTLRDLLFDIRRYRKVCDTHLHLMHSMSVCTTSDTDNLRVGLTYTKCNPTDNKGLMLKLPTQLCARDKARVYTRTSVRIVPKK